MRITHHPGHRLAGLVALCSMLAVLTATNAAAYPVGPDGENLYVEAQATQSSLAPDPVLKSVDSGAAVSTPSDTASLPAVEVSSTGTDWGAVLSVLAGAGIAALAVIAAALVLSGIRRRSAAAH